jgi:hypothetical protein
MLFSPPEAFQLYPVFTIMITGLIFQFSNRRGIKEDPILGKRAVLAFRV